jgi:hypothetical protein
LTGGSKSTGHALSGSDGYAAPMAVSGGSKLVIFVAQRLTAMSETPAETRDSRRGGNAAAERDWIPGLDQNRPMGVVQEIGDRM